MSSLRPIVLAEDNPNDVELTLAALQELKLANEIVVVRDGAEALEWLFRRGAFAGRTSQAPAVVLLDLKMPKLNGHEVLAHMRASAELRTIPVVVLTSSREESDLFKSYNLGVNAYVVKPMGLEEFVAAIGKVGAFWAVINEPPPLGGASL